MMVRWKLALRAGSRKSLWIVAALLVGSGLIRFGVGPGQAIAREVAALVPSSSATESEQYCENDKVTSEILSKLLVREDKVLKQEQSLAEKQQRIALSEVEIRKNLAALEKAERALSATISKAQTASEDDLSKLTAVYENMKPKDASVLFEEMAPQFAAGFVARMRPDAAAQIMAGLDPAKAYSISVILAGRNALTPSD